MDASKKITRTTINWMAALTKHVENPDVDLPFVDDALLENYIKTNLTKVRRFFECDRFLLDVPSNLDCS